MHTQFHDTCRAAARTTHLYLFAVGALIVAIGLADSVSAALIGVSFSYDGNVRIDTTTGVEAHDLSPIFPPNPATVSVTNGPLNSPLQPARQLSVVETEFIDSFMGMSVQHVVITIAGQGGGTNNPFVNPLDTNIPNPVLFDASFYSNNLPANQMLMLVGSGVEDGNDLPPVFPTPPVVSTSGIGTQNVPWNVHMELPENLVSFTSNGWAKIHLYYKFGALIPEPTTSAMLLLGIFGLAGAFRRGRRS